MLHHPTAKTLGELLLSLYEAARSPSVEDFQEQALDKIAGLIPFDGSIWGIGTVTSGKTVVSGAHLRDFNEEAVEFLNREDARNIVGEAIREKPGVAHIFSSDVVFDDPDTEYIWERLGGFEEVLCHGSIDGTSGLLSFVAIARHAGGGPFTEEDAHWLEILAPHLEATLQICRVSELQFAKSDTRAHRTVRAICDARGVLHVAEPGFAAFVAEAWPHWQGPLLPRELIEIASQTGNHEFRKGNLTVHASGVAQQRIIAATRKLPVDLLTPQELVVARAFAKGLTYKEVAKQLSRSPATIRHHLRSVYAKLEISDKGALARTLFEADA